MTAEGSAKGSDSQAVTESNVNTEPVTDSMSKTVTKSESHVTESKSNVRTETGPNAGSATSHHDRVTKPNSELTSEHHSHPKINADSKLVTDAKTELPKVTTIKPPKNNTNITLEGWIVDDSVSGMILSGSQQIIVPSEFYLMPVCR